MPSVLQQLGDNQAALLMYLADELPAADRAEVERMLEVDSGLRAELEQWREAYGSFCAEVAREDATVPLAVPEAVAVRRVGRAMRQWNARRLAAAPAANGAGRGLRYPWWAYPVAAAASVVIAFLVWWGHTDRVPMAERDLDNAAPFVGQYAGASVADPSTAADYRSELIARSLGVGEYPPEAPGGSPDWDEAGSLYAAVDASDDNVLMLLNTDIGGQADDINTAPDNDPSYQ